MMIKENRSEIKDYQKGPCRPFAMKNETFQLNEFAFLPLFTCVFIETVSFVLCVFNLSINLSWVFEGNIPF